MSVSEWTDIVQIVGGSSFIAGLKSDGTVVIDGTFQGFMDSSFIQSWRNVVFISAGFRSLAAVKFDGSVFFSGEILKETIIQA